MFYRLLSLLVAPWEWSVALDHMMRRRRPRTEDQPRHRYQSPAKLRRDADRLAKWLELKTRTCSPSDGLVVVESHVEACSDIDASESHVEAALHLSDWDADDEGGDVCGVPCVACVAPPIGTLPAIDMLLSLVKLILASKTEFGCYACRFMRGASKQHVGRIRDVFPLPRIASLTDLGSIETSTAMPEALLLDMSNLAISALSFLDGQERGCVDRAATALQQSVQKRVIKKICAYLDRLAQNDPAMIDSSFGSFVRRGASSKYPTLVADLVDGLNSSGQVDPLPYLDNAVRTIVTSGARLFPNGVASVGTKARFTAGPRAEYIRLLIRYLRSSKVGLTTRALSNGTVFAVSKTNGHQREVWHGGPISAQALSPPKPPLQITPSSLVHLETAAGLPFYVSKKDGTSFFDQLALPPDLGQYMGRPPRTSSRISRDRRHDCR